MSAEDGMLDCRVWKRISLPHSAERYSYYELGDQFGVDPDSESNSYFEVDEYLEIGGPPYEGPVPEGTMYFDCAEKAVYIKDAHPDPNQGPWLRVVSAQTYYFLNPVE